LLHPTQSYELLSFFSRPALVGDTSNRLTLVLEYLQEMAMSTHLGVMPEPYGPTRLEERRSLVRPHPRASAQPLQHIHKQYFVASNMLLPSSRGTPAAYRPFCLVILNMIFGVPDAAPAPALAPISLSLEPTADPSSPPPSALMAPASLSDVGVPATGRGAVVGPLSRESMSSAAAISSWEA
jgi:hypothetical protein